MSSEGQADSGEGRRELADVLASAVARADGRELEEDAVSAGEDMAAAAAALRARFLARVAHARTRAAVQDTLVDAEASDESSELPADGEAESEAESEVELNPMAIGRYPILRRLGAGGMGVVYAAYDEILDRRVALKVLHDHVWDVDGRRRERLLREAQAMARVTHPNVVTVHEVGTAGDQLFVAMEFVAGPTLKEWLAANKRTWREIVAVFRQVAEGLSAIHEAGLVHRDVKPANVIIGDDGRARVLDLGLVGADRSELDSGSHAAAAPSPSLDPTEAEISALATKLSSSPSSSSSLNRIAGALTMTGERLGTPAYMSREQFLGLEPTPASDIFSLCVALYEALHGIHPFNAETFYELQAKVVGGKITPPPSMSSVPAWLHAEVVRGLASDPKHRHASMRALGAALDKDPSRVRRRWIGTLGVAVLAAISGVVVARVHTPTTPPPVCDGGHEAVASAWDQARASEIRAAMLASGRPYAAALAGRVIVALDDYANAWADAHRRICTDHARGKHSAALLDARMACLDRRRQALAETATILTEANADVVEHAGQMVARLPRLEPCDDLATLAARRPPPADPRLASTLAELESRLVRAEALVNAGRLADASELARAVAREAEALEQPVILVSALLSEARAALDLQGDRSAVRAQLDRGLAISIEEGLDGLAAEAMIRRLYARGLAEGGSAAALADLPLAEAMLNRAGGDTELRALLLNNAGTVRLAAGDREGARADFERSLTLKERLFGDDHLELTPSLANLGILSSEPAIRQQLHARMIDICARRLGPDHPRTLDARQLAAFYTADPERAAAALGELCPRFVEIDEPRLAGECELERGRLELARARLDLAHEAFVAARGQLDRQHRRSAILDAYLDLTGGEPEAAIIELREQIASLDADEDSRDWWYRLAQAERRLLLARLLAADGAVAEGTDSLERAIAELESIADQGPEIERERMLAEAQAALVLVLAASETADRSRIFALARAARAYFDRWPRAYALRLAELDNLHVSSKPN